MVTTLSHDNELPRDDYEEFGWIETARTGEVSPASLWGLDDERTLPRKGKDPTTEGTLNTSEPSSESLVEESDSKEISEPALSGTQDSFWWTQPDISQPKPEEIHNNEVALDPGLTPSELDSYSLAVDDDSRQNPEAFDDEPITAEVPVVVVAPPETSDVLKEGAEAPALEAVDDLVQTEVPVIEVAPRGDIVREEKLPLASFDDASLSAKREVVTDSAEKFEVTKKENPRVIVLDETTVLPHEASFATVKLEKEIAVPRLLNDSAVLANEASFATVNLYQTASYSPSTEFVAKFTHKAKRVVPIFLIVAVCAGAIVFSLKYKYADDASASPSAAAASKPPSRSVEAPVTPQATAQYQSESAVSVRPVGNSEPIKETATLANPSTAGPVAEKVSAVSERRINSSPSGLEATSNNDKKIRPETSPQPIAKHSAPQKARINESRPQKAVVTTAPKAEEKPPKSEPETVAPSSGGGERPRRVKPETQPGTPAKPKLIDWP